MQAKWLESFKEFPPRARSASFSIDQVVDKLMPRGDDAPPMAPEQPGAPARARQPAK
jgi:hypothetical protein